MTDTLSNPLLRSVLLRGAFRTAMTALPGGVTIVTSMDRESGRDVGITASAVCSVSEQPPKVLFCVKESSKSHGILVTAEKIAINVLHSGQAEIARRFGSSAENKFSDPTAFFRSVDGIPLLRNAAAVLECAVDMVIRAGDHSVVIADVTNSSQRTMPPLIYFDRALYSARPLDSDSPMAERRR